MMTDHIILVLGFTNDDEGNLHPIAKRRAETAYCIFRDHPDAEILLTGGRGNHFNLTGKPHAAYTRSYLEALGVPPGAFMDFAESANTIEDARLSKEALDGTNVKKITLITSDFHMERVQFLFSEIYGGLYEMTEFVAVPSDGEDPQILSKFREHEELALRTLKKHGIENYYKVKLG